jgi:hypothetical protein
MTFNQAMKEVANGYYVNRGSKIVGPLRTGSDKRVYTFRNTDDIERNLFISEYVPNLDDMKAKDWTAYEGDSDSDLEEKC